MPPARRRAAAGTISVGLVLAATLGTLALGALIKHPCAAGVWADGRQYRRLCYSDIVPLLAAESLQGNRLPYLDPCPPRRGQCDEYPVLTMYFMRLAAWASVGAGSFFYSNAVLLAALAVLTTWALHRMVGGRALYFAIAPSLLIYGFMNWDLIAVSLTTLATLLYLQGRDVGSGALLGLGVAAKLYPGLLLVPLAAGRLRRGHPKAAVALLASAAATWVLTNGPFALTAPEGWSIFFRFNAGRGADWDSIWFVACTGLGSRAGCSWPTDLLNLATALGFLGLCAAAWSARTVREPSFPLWTLGFPVLVAFLLTSKVYSPQYGLWLLPWFALALPNPWLFAAFSVADVVVFMTRFTWFGRFSAEQGDPVFAGFGGASLRMFQIAILARALVLVACLVAWVMQGRDEPEQIGPSHRRASVDAA